MRQLTFFLLLSTTVTLWAQPKQNSPYSRFGIGDPVNQAFADQIGAGGQTAAYHDPLQLNLSNPASYAFLRTTALQTGLQVKYSHFTTNPDTSTLNRWTGNLGYIALGFTLRSPINEVLDKAKSPWKFGMGFSLTPYSLIGYNVQTHSSTSDLPGVTNTYQGNGGTYRTTWSSAARYKNTAVGLNLGWMFGKATYENTTDFDGDTLVAFINNRRNSLTINGFVWTLGIQHDIVLKYFQNDAETPQKWITIGGTIESNHSLHVTSDNLFIRTRNTSPDGTYTSPDTLINDKGVRQTLTLPASFTFGIQYVDAAKMRVGVQFGRQQWANYVNQARPETLRNTMSVSGGLEYTPDMGSYNNYAKRIRYRIGGYYRQDPRTVNGSNVDDTGLSLGFGFPIVMPRQQTAFMNVAFELGKIGAGTPIAETYGKVTVGFTLNDNTWFYKRRFE
jgi:hypothetical protein